MQYRNLGSTGLRVSEICLGGWTFGNREGVRKAVGDLQYETVEQIVSTALEGGVNFIDTADVYASGESERLIGLSLERLGVRRRDVIVATKVAGEIGKGPNERGASRARIMDGVRESLDRLRVDYIDLYQIHASDQTPVDETLRALDDLVSQGLVRYIGCSNWPAWKTMKAMGLCERHGWSRLASAQVYYSIAGRDIEREIVDMAQDQGLGLLLWSPLAGGLLSGKFEDGVPPDARRASFDFPPVDRVRASACVATMRPLAERHGVSVAQIALAYVLAKPFTSSVIIGAKSVEQLKDNLASTAVELSKQELESLDAASALPKEYPLWMIEAQIGERAPQRFQKS